MVLLAFLVLITGFPISAPTQVEAAGAPSSTNVKPYPTGAWFEDGKFIFVSPNKKASASIRYGTKAFILRTDPVCNSDNPDTAQCIPGSSTTADTLRINIYNNDGSKNTDWTWSDTDECVYENFSGCSNNVLVTRFEISKDKFTALLSSHSTFKDWKDGQTVYLNTIFRVINDSRYPEFTKEFTSLRDIYTAEFWANPSYFRNYYDVSVTFYGSYPIKVQNIIDSAPSTLVSERSIDSTFGPPGDDKYTAEMWPAWGYDKSKSVGGTGIVLDKTITSGGKTYALQCSYVTRISDPEVKTCADTGNEPYWVRDGKTTERSPAVYVGGTYVRAVYGLASCKCFTEATIPNKSDLEGEVPVDNTVIGKKVTMQVDLQQSPEDYDDWVTWSADKTDFQIRTRVWRSDQTDVLTGLSNTGAAPIWTKGKVLEPDTGSGTTNPVGRWVLLAYLDGGQDSKVLFNDDLTNYPIPEGGKVSFRYNADVIITAKDAGGNLVTINCSRPTSSTEMSWFRPVKPKVNEGSFFSVPQYYSEIKEGSPQTSGTSANENFDAMSGTPTTRSLYFASGGSEFMVDVQVEYVPKVTQTRTYRSHFTAVVNGHAMSPIDGGKSDPAPSAPTPRQTTDACGVVYTESVTQTSEAYIKGYTSGPTPSPIWGTKYGWYQSGHDFSTRGPYEDNWTQTVTFDYMKIDKAVMWKIERSKVNGMATLVSTNEVTANITQGDPTWFYNRATSNTSAAGRLRYDLETNQHDTVVWNEGSVDNCVSNSKDSGPVVEQTKFTERRNLTTNVTAVSDFLILQTSSGDQSVMYFEKTSNTAKTTDQLDVPTTDFATMWTNNSLSAAQWDQQDTIKLGSYNGNYGSPTNKYSPSGGGTVSTIFDSKPAGLSRPGRPGSALRIMQTGLDVPDTLRNGEYITGTSSIFYRNILNDNPENLPTAYSVQANAQYGGTGLAFTTAYSPIHSKVNDVVIHNPVSVQDALIISLPSSLDQRSTESPIGGNKQEGVAEYQRVLDPNYRQNVLPNPDAEIVNVDGTVAGWNTWVASGSGANITFTHRAGDMWVIGPGAKTFEVNTAASTGTTGGYWKDIPIKPNTNYRFEADISCHRCIGYFSLDLYTSGMGWITGGIGSGDPNNATGVQHKTFNFTSPANAAYVRVHMIKGNNVDAVSYSRDYLFVDNMSLKNMSVQEFVAVAPVNVTQEVPNPDYVAPASGTNQTFNYTGSTQTFTAPKAGNYTLETWGAQGSYYNGGLGGYSKGDVYLTAGQTLTIQVGGTGGYNGGGVSTGNGSGTITGGGASDVRTGGASLAERIIVAGGGGGGGDANGGVGNNSSASYSLGSGESYSHGCGNNVGPGGGGYYGGYSSQDGSGTSAQGGSGYVGGVTGGSMQSGIQSGNGRVVITLPPQAAVGTPTKVITTVAGGSDTSPPSDAYILQPVTVDPAAPAGGFSPGNFVLLDYGFQLFYPNTGDFYGNGQWGWSQTTEIRGKGFIDDMDTTEWTKSKYVKFEFNVIYDNVLYKADEWIQLPLNSPAGNWRYDFYIPLANREKISSMVEWKSIAINAPFEDNDTPSNKVRYNTPRQHAAKHSTLKKYNIDVVGRIGNMVIEDTGDFRFSNLFKQPLVPDEWLIPNVVKRVNQNAQNRIVGDTVNIRGDNISAGTRYLNTYGLLSHMEQNPVTFPLTPLKNNIPALQNQPMRLGYEVLSDIQTIGNYYSNLQVIPYYYHVNLQNGAITPVDIYMDVDSEYKIINKHGGVFSGWNPASVYSNPVRLDWDSQAGRRNASTAERDQTSMIAGLFAESGGDTATGKAAEPFGSYLYGNSQFLQLTGRNRTYIGRDETYGFDKNPSNKLTMMEYAMQGQRWHYSYVLPSSAVAVRSGQQATQANISALRTNTGVIVMAANIKSIGDTYTLQYRNSGNGSLSIAGTTWPLTGIPYPVISVFSANKSSADDLEVSGTH